MSRTDATSTYHLGGSVFASVKTWGGRVRIHVTSYDTSVNIKTRKANKKCVTLDQAEFQKLIKIQKRILIDFYVQSKDLAAKNLKKNPTCDQDVGGPFLTETTLPFVTETNHLYPTVSIAESNPIQRLLDSVGQHPIEENEVSSVVYPDQQKKKKLKRQKNTQEQP